MAFSSYFSWFTGSSSTTPSPTPTATLATTPSATAASVATAAAPPDRAEDAVFVYPRDTRVEEDLKKQISRLEAELLEKNQALADKALALEVALLEKNKTLADKDHALEEERKRNTELSMTTANMAKEVAAAHEKIQEATERAAASETDKLEISRCESQAKQALAELQHKFNEVNYALNQAKFESKAATDEHIAQVNAELFALRIEHEKLIERLRLSSDKADYLARENGKLLGELAENAEVLRKRDAEIADFHRQRSAHTAPTVTAPIVPDESKDVASDPSSRPEPAAEVREFRGSSPAWNDARRTQAVAQNLSTTKTRYAAIMGKFIAERTSGHIIPHRRPYVTVLASTETQSGKMPTISR